MSSASVKRELRTCLSAVSYTSRGRWSSVTSDNDWEDVREKAGDLWASHLQVEPEAPQGAMGVPYGKFKVEALSDEELEVENVRSGCSRDVGGVRVERDGIVRRFGRQKQRCQPGCGSETGGKGGETKHMMFLGCQSMTVFLR